MKRLFRNLTTDVAVTVLCLVLTAALALIFVLATKAYGLPKSLNEVGDSISGFSSALAFIWLVGGYFIQQYELRKTRQEYEQMRVNADIQASVVRRQDVVNGAEIQFRSLDHAVKNFESQVALLGQPVLGTSAERLPPMFAFGFLAQRCQKLQAENKTTELKQLQRYAPSLNKEVCRYAQVYSQLEEFLGSAGEDGAWVRSVLLEGSVYQDVMSKIRDASGLDGVCGSVFSLPTIAR